MPPETQHRATIAGVGTTAALLAAVMAVSLIIGGLVAYTASPSGPLATAQPALQLPSQDEAIGRTTVAARRVVLAPAPTAAVAAASLRAAAGTGGASGRPAGVDGRRPAGSSVGGTVSGPTTGSSGPGTTATQPVTPTQALNNAISPVLAAPKQVTRNLTQALASTTSSTGTATAGVLDQTFTGLGATVGRVAPELGAAITGGGTVTGRLVTQTTGALADVVRRLGS